jgi:hypothetical protein
MGLSSIRLNPRGSVPGEIPDSLHRKITIERLQVDLARVDAGVAHQRLERLQRARASIRRRYGSGNDVRRVQPSAAIPRSLNSMREHGAHVERRGRFPGPFTGCPTELSTPEA